MCPFNLLWEAHTDTTVMLPSTADVKELMAALLRTPGWITGDTEGVKTKAKTRVRRKALAS